jgi:hypothetical protein
MTTTRIQRLEAALAWALDFIDYSTVITDAPTVDYESYLQAKDLLEKARAAA